MAASATPRMELLHRFESVGTSIFALDVSEDGNLIAAACNDGADVTYTAPRALSIAPQVFHAATKKLQYTLGRASDDSMPIMGVRFRPPGMDSQGARHVLLAVGVDGSVRRWHVSTGRKLFDTHEKDNEVFCCDYSEPRSEPQPRCQSVFITRNLERSGAAKRAVAPCVRVCAAASVASGVDGQRFATAGLDKCVRVYDDERMDVVTTLKAGYGAGARGHTNRIFSVKFSDESPFTLLSGGWDRCVHVWDTRTGRSERDIFGPYICGDGIDVRSGVVVTAACRPNDPLELWDLGTASKIRSVPWRVSKVGGSLPCTLFGAAFSKDPAGRLLAAGGSMANETRLFDRTRRDAHVGTAAGFSGPVFALAWHSDRRLAVAGNDGIVRLMKVSGGDHATPESLSAAALIAEGDAEEASASAAAAATVRVGEAGSADADAHPGSPSRTPAGEAVADDAGDEWAADASGDEEADRMLREARARARALEEAAPAAAGAAGAAAAGAAAASGAGIIPGHALAGSGAQAARQLARARLSSPIGESESKDVE
ncbi:ago [Symbiodinium sp. KB8]|nr:ago [Symbiodinium sp. KB8]